MVAARRPQTPRQATEHHQDRNPRVVLSERLGEVTAEERRLEHSIGATVVVAPLWSSEDITRHAVSADVIVIGAVEPFSADVLQTLPRCRLLVRRGVGCDNVDLQAATDLGIPVAYVPDASVEEVSDHALALLLALERRVVALDALVHEGAWSDDPGALRQLRQEARRLSTLTLGVVGLGRIGQALARKAGPLFARILGSDPQVTQQVAGEHGVSLVSFEQLVRESDLISIHAPLTDGTAHLFAAETFRIMRSTTQLVNTSRGGLVDEEALVAAIRDGELAGAALDVTEREPLPPDSPLLEVGNILVTGHAAAHSATSTQELRRRAMDAVITALGEGQQPPLANPEVASSASYRLRNRASS
jgi:D-3-phosphoglycerate dehydrogenase / 2-oxoglutarate reductase